MGQVIKFRAAGILSFIILFQLQFCFCFTDNPDLHNLKICLPSFLGDKMKVHVDE